MDTTTNQLPQNSSTADCRKVVNLVTEASEISVSVRCDDVQASITLTKYVLNDRELAVRQTLLQQISSLLLSLKALDLIQRLEQSSSTSSGLADQTLKSDKP